MKLNRLVRHVERHVRAVGFGDGGGFGVGHPFVHEPRRVIGLPARRLDADFHVRHLELQGLKAVDGLAEGGALSGVLDAFI